MIKSPGGILLLILLLLTAHGGLFGQRKDFQTWHEVELDQELKNGIEFSTELEQRFRNNMSRHDQSMVTFAGEYDFTSYLSAATGMRILVTTNRESRVHTRYRVHADATGSYSLFDVDLSLRLRFQYGFEDFFYFSDFTSNGLSNRIRLKAAHHIFGTKFGVYATVESWGAFISNDGRFYKKIRYSAGTTYALNFRSEFSLRYILEDEFNQVNPLQSYILVFGFAYHL